MNIECCKPAFIYKVVSWEQWSFRMFCLPPNNNGEEWNTLTSFFGQNSRFQCKANAMTLVINTSIHQSINQNMPPLPQKEHEFGK